MASPQANNGIPTGQLEPWSTWGHYNNVLFSVLQAINKMQTATLVQVVSCTNSGGVSPVGFVDILPLVNQVDANNIAWPHTTIYNVPYLRMQGGSNAIILDPQVGDIGICIFASRDISKIKNTKAQGNPGSQRKYDFADGMYLGGLLNGVPNQYVQFDSSGVSIVSPQKITLSAPTVEIDAPTGIILNGPLTQGTGSNPGGATLQGPLTVNEDVTASGTSVHTHIHSGVESGPDNTGEPVT